MSSVYNVSQPVVSRNTLSVTQTSTVCLYAESGRQLVLQCGSACSNTTGFGFRGRVLYSQRNSILQKESYKGHNLVCIRLNQYFVCVFSNTYGQYINQNITDQLNILSFDVMQTGKCGHDSHCVCRQDYACLSSNIRCMVLLNVVRTYTLFVPVVTYMLSRYIIIPTMHYHIT